MKVTLSGLTWGVMEGGGLFQTERPDIPARFTPRRAGFGTQWVGDLSAEDARTLERGVRSYGELFTGPGLDPDDRDTPREGRACLKDADRIAKQLAPYRPKG